MCGVCGGIWTSGTGALDLSTLNRATDALSHRGPDDRDAIIVPLTRGGSASESGVALGHRRLAIVDLTAAGRQPFVNQAGTIRLTFNGEIYNYLELRAELERRGRTFRTQTDVEVLLASYEEFGLDCLAKFNGMFAFALWDETRQRFILARDRIGKKPLVYHAREDRLVFASELKSLRQFPATPSEVDLKALRLYLTYQYVPHPLTIYKGVYKLPPASVLIWRPGHSPRIEEYWRPERVGNFPDAQALTLEQIRADVADESLAATDFDQPQARLASLSRNLEEPQCVATTSLPDAQLNALNFTRASFEEVKSELRRRLENAVRLRMRSDAPYGAFLSGGIDSTIVVGLMSQFATQKVRTFSIGFRQKEYDETDFARRTAARFGCDHTEFVVEPKVEELLPQLVAQYDEPFADSSAIPTWYLCQMTRSEVTVALGGDGGDELFCGYDRYKAVRLSQTLNRLPRALRAILAGPVRAMIPNSTRQRSLPRRARRFLETLGMSALEQYLQWIAIFNRSRLGELLTDRYWDACRLDASQERYNAQEPGTLEFLQNAYEKFSQRDLVSAISFLDTITYLPCDLMTKVDIDSMAHSLEVRAPFLDANVVELALQTPLQYKLRGGKGKFIVREACRDLLPAEIDARPKTGFGVPLDSWFRGPLNRMLKETLLDTSGYRDGLLNRDYVERLVKEHEQRVFDHAARLWSLMVWQLWKAQVK
ncbi:MAG: asparagine synthase-related protein [Planctomycetia bacterium]|nr:asparagine synthase-related protein [Planctomycetia bacterium]